METHTLIVACEVPHGRYLLNFELSFCQRNMPWHHSKAISTTEKLKNTFSVLALKQHEIPFYAEI